MDLLRSAKCIWSTAEAEKRDQYRVFRKKFILTENNEDKFFLRIAADSTFDVRVNGRRCLGQQLADLPGKYTESLLDLSGMVRLGENEILIEVHYRGRTCLTYCAGRAFLCAAVTRWESILCATDASWQWAPAPVMRSGVDVQVSGQLGETFIADLRGAEGKVKWHDAVEVPGTEEWTISPRPVPQLLEHPCPAVTIVQCGFLERAGERATAAATAAADYLSPRDPQKVFSSLPDGAVVDGTLRRRPVLTPDGASPLKFAPLPEGEHADGRYLIADLGEETVGYLTLALTAPAGTVVDICHGEHLDDGRVRAAIGSRNFADRLICREGENEFLYTHRRLGARYLELHLTGIPEGGEVSLRRLSLIPLSLPLPAAAGFRCDDRLLEKIRQVSVRTLDLCMHEHYEDCPWREQALYPYDSRNQMLYGYYVWGNCRFAAASLDLLGGNFDGDRYLRLTSPGRSSLTIPIFTLIWIVELYEYQLYSGDSSQTSAWLGQVDRILDRALEDEVPGFPGLHHPGDSKEAKLWNFC